MTKQRRAHRTRRALIAAAAQEFDRHGYAGTSLSAVHRACGMTMGALTFHFPTKRDLAVAVCSEAEALTRQALTDLRPPPTVPAVVDLTLTVTRLLAEEVTVRAAARLAHEQTTSLTSWPTVWRSALHELVASLPASEGAVPEPSELELLAVYLTAGAEATLRAGQSGPVVQKQLEHLWSVVLDAVPHQPCATCGGTSSPSPPVAEGPFP